jgi:D-amino-acid oxidase
MATASVLVIGCGVIGLSCAIELQRAGYSVRIAARALPPNTVSNVAAAIWYPYAVAPAERCIAWAHVSYGVFGELAQDPKTGVILRSGVELYPAGVEAIEFLRELPGSRDARAAELRSGYTHGVCFEAPVIDTSVYMDWLVQQFLRDGGQIEVREFQELSQAVQLAPIVVNCSGLGARELARDSGVYPIRGQILRVERHGLEKFALDHDPGGGTTYVIPRLNDCVLGGTREEHSEELAINTQQSADIQRRALALVPELDGAQVLGALVGLRPGRAVVRLEVEARDNSVLVHNYGHGGGGVTLSWGCAREVRELISHAQQRR